MQLLVNYSKMKQATLWVAELVNLSSLQTCVLLSLFTVTSASPPWALHSLSLFLSHTFHRPSQDTQLCAGCLCPAEQGQHVLWLVLGTVCVGWPGCGACYPAWEPWGPSHGISPLPSYWFPSNLWELQFWDFHALPDVTETNQRVMTRGTDRQADSVI